MNVKEMKDMVKNYISKEKEASGEDLDFGLKLEIDEAVYRKVMYWVQKSPYEISGLGNVVLDQETNTLRVVSAILLPQKNTGTTTDIDAVDVSKAMFTMRNEPGQLRWWFHSHVNMNVFWSGTDIATIKQLGNGGWYCATVFNKRNEMKSAFCQKSPVRLLASDVPTQISVNSALSTEWDAEYEKNVKVEETEYSFREKQSFFEQQLEQQEAFEERTQETQETTKENEESEWEKVTDEVGNILRYYRKKKNLVPVQKRTYQENQNLKEDSETDVKTGQLSLADLADESELAKWERSSSDEEELAVDEYLKRHS